VSKEKYKQIQHSTRQKVSSASEKGSSAFVETKEIVRQKLEKNVVLRFLLGLDVLKGTNPCRISLVPYKYTTYSFKKRGQYYIVD
jgi:hypothetical protein